MTRNNILPHSKTITLSGNLKAKLYCENLSDDIVENIVNQIKGQDKKYYNFKELVNNEDNKPLQFYVYNDRDSYQAHTGSDSKYGHYDHSSNTMYTYRDPNANDAFLYDARHIARAEGFLSNKDQLKLSDNLQVILRYNKLNNKELKAIKQEIKGTFDEYKEEFGIEDHGRKTITFFLYNNKKDYHDHGGAGQVGCGGNKYCVNQVDVRDSTNILNAYRYVYGDDLPLRTQVSYALSHHNVNTGVRMLPEREELPDTEIQSYELEEDEDEGSGMQYEMVNGRLQITNKNDDTFIVPKTFGYLKRVKEDGEEKFTLCNKKGKEYTKIGENRYINTEEIMNKSDNFDTFCSKKCHIEADKKEPQMAKIVDLKSKKIRTV